MNKQIDELMNAMQERLPHKRYVHSLGVAYLAASIAMAYGKNQEKSMIAGLLHDCAKCLPDDEILRQCIEKGLKVSDIEKEQSYLLHGKLGAWYAENEYGIHDEKILNAIRFHTTGHADMCFIEKNIYLSDYIELGRSQKTSPGLDEIRKIAFTDIDLAVYYAAKNTVDYLKRSEKEAKENCQKYNKIDDTSYETLCFYAKKCNQTI